MAKWKKIFSTEHSYRAEMVKIALNKHHYHAIIVNKKSTAYNLGLYEVHVPQDEILFAIKIIQNEIHFD